jgi:hypothetical protein
VLRSSCCLTVALARASIAAYSSLLSCSSFYVWASSLSTTACPLLYRTSITSKRFYLASAFSFSVVVRYMSKETQNERCSRSSLMSSLSQ